MPVIIPALDIGALRLAFAYSPLSLMSGGGSAMKRPVERSILRRVHFCLGGRNSCSRGFLQSQRLARSRGPENPY